MMKKPNPAHATREGWGRENLDLDAAQEAGERAHALPSEASPPPPRRRRHRWARMTPPPSRRRLTRRARDARRGSRSHCGQQRGALGDSLASTFQAAYRSSIGSSLAPVVVKLARPPLYDSCSYHPLGCPSLSENRIPKACRQSRPNLSGRARRPPSVSSWNSDSRKPPWRRCPGAHSGPDAAFRAGSSRPAHWHHPSGRPGGDAAHPQLARAAGAHLGHDVAARRSRTILGAPGGS